MVSFQCRRNSGFCLKRDENTENQGKMSRWRNCFGFFLAWEQGDDSRVIPWRFKALCWVLDQQILKSSGNSSVSCTWNFTPEMAFEAGDCSFPARSQQRGICSQHNPGRKQFLGELALM